MNKEIYFEVITPLGVRVRTTKDYWNYIVDVKHQTMRGKEEIVKETLQNPEEICRSKIDLNVYLYYKKYDKIYCVIVKHEGTEGFLITAYPSDKISDKIKEGEKIWRK